MITTRAEVGRWLALLGLCVSTAGCVWPAAPGHRQIADARRVWAENDCGMRGLPILQLERNEVRPATVKPGAMTGHRFVYSLCLPEGAAEVRGRLRTRIYHGAELVLTDVVPDHPLRPGRWVVNTRITVPSAAPGGAYSVRLDFAAPGRVSFDGAAPMVVRP